MYLKNINSQISFIRERINAKINLDLKVNKLYDVLNIRQFVNNELKQQLNLGPLPRGGSGQPAHATGATCAKVPPLDQRVGP